MSYCVNCAAEIGEGEQFCRKCGTPIKAETPVVCPECGFANKPGDRLCLNCGSAISMTIEDRFLKNREETVSAYRGKNFDELVSLADNGDSQAMVLVADYYTRLDDSHEINGMRPKKAAVDLYEKAALAGNAGGIPFICSEKKQASRISEANFGVASDAVITDKREVFKWYDIGYELYMKKAPGSEAINASEFISGMEEARYDLANSLYFAKALDESYLLVSDRRDITSQILEQLILHTKLMERITDAKHEVNDMDVDAVDASVKSLSIILKNDDYGEKPKSFGEEMVYVLTAEKIAIVDLRVYKDKKKTFECLDYVRKFLKEERAITYMNKVTEGLKAEAAAK